jgi:hypothetical protein
MGWLTDPVPPGYYRDSSGIWPIPGGPASGNQNSPSANAANATTTAAATQAASQDAATKAASQTALAQLAETSKQNAATNAQAAADAAEKEREAQASEAVASGQLTIQQAQERLAEQTAADKAAGRATILSYLTGQGGSGSLAALSSVGGGGSASSAPSSSLPADLPLWAQPGSTTPAPWQTGGSGSGGPLDPNNLSPAERATETSAREQNGLALQSGIRDTDALMSARGIEGSGIHSAALRGLVAQSLGDSAATDRSIIQNRADVAEKEKLAEMGYDSARSIASGNNATQLQIANLNASNARLNALLGVYGQLY